MSQGSQSHPRHRSNPPDAGQAGGLDTARRRLAWRCRRGLLELDLVLQRFLATGYGRLDPSKQRAFEALLACPDHLLLAWLNGREPPTTEFEYLVRKLQQLTVYKY